MANKTFALNESTSLNQTVWCWDDDVDFAAGTAWTKSLSDTITLSDALSSKAIGKVLADTITISDAISRVWHAFLSLSDTITITDSIGKLFTKVQTDIITLSDNVSKTVGKVFTDTVTVTDNLFKAIAKGLADTITISDAIIKGLRKIFSDTITISDAISLMFIAGKGTIPKIRATLSAIPGYFSGLTRPRDAGSKSTNKPNVV